MKNTIKISKKEAELIQNVATAIAGLDWDAEDVIVDELDVRSASGCYRTAFILDKVVIKVSQERSRVKALVKEAEFIQKMREDPKIARHFPHTEIFKVGRVTMQIQEKVNMSHRGITWEMHEQVERLADRLGIDDCHDENYGWRQGKHGPVPVFVDVDFRFRNNRKRKVRSWM